MKAIREIIRPRKESEPWNKGKIIGQKPPLLPKHVWAIRTNLQMGRRVRDLALFNLAIDSKLRGCDVVRLRLEDVAPNGYAIERAIIRQQKTGHPVKFELIEQTRCSVDEYSRFSRLAISGARRPGEPFDDKAIRSSLGSVARSGWPRLNALRYALTPAHKGDADLQTHWKSSCGPASAWSYEDREHGQISRYRGGRRSRDL